MTKFLDNLRSKPLHTRKRIALISSCGIFSIIFLVWWFSFSTVRNDSQLTSSEVFSPLEVVANVAKSTRDGIKSLPIKLKNQLNYTSAESDPYKNGNTNTKDIVYPNQLMNGIEKVDFSSTTPSN